MAEERDALESPGAEAPLAGVDPVAAAIALAGASRAEADGFLRKQSHFIDLQTEHLHEQRDLLLSRLRLGRFSDRVKAGLQVMTGLIGAVLIIGLIAAAWNASQADGMVVDAFSVPPGFAQDDITGEVVAGDLTDKIATIRQIADSDSLSTAKEVQADSAQEVTVEIPETGISLGQAWRYLRLWLGHERHVSGNLRRLGDGKIALTVTLDAAPVVTASGAAADLDRLEQRAAEQIFAHVDPVNIVLYLLVQGRTDESLAAAARAPQLVETGELSNAYSLWAFMARNIVGDLPLTVVRARLSIAVNPNQMAAHRELMWAFFWMGHDEQALQQARIMQTLKEGDQPKTLRGSGFTKLVDEGVLWRATALGAFSPIVSAGLFPDLPQAERWVIEADMAARAHDGGTSRALLGQATTLDAKAVAAALIDYSINIHRVRYDQAVNVGDWPAAIKDARAFAASASDGGPGMTAITTRMEAMPMLAFVLARGGDSAGAQATIAATPGDCYICIRTRGLIAAAAKQWGRADYWFARAVQQAPSIPFAYADWGQSLLERGQPDAAIAKFTVASQKGPHFADPLEMWGEALMAKNQSHLALAKFEEANKYVPNWGRLHLKWGEALTYAGKPADAKAQFARAATLDLAPSEKAELSTMGQETRS